MVPNICNLFFGFLIQHNSKRMQYSRHSQIAYMYEKRSVWIAIFLQWSKAPRGTDTMTGSGGGLVEITCFAFLNEDHVTMIRRFDILFCSLKTVHASMNVANFKRICAHSWELSHDLQSWHGKFDRGVRSNLGNLKPVLAWSIVPGHFQYVYHVWNKQWVRNKINAFRKDFEHLALFLAISKVLPFSKRHN